MVVPAPDGTARMAARLAELAGSMEGENGFNNQAVLERLRARIAERRSVQEQVLLQQTLGWELLKVAENEEAAVAFRAAADLLEGVAGDEPRKAREMLYGNLGMAYLRVAEQDNCICDRNCDSCLLPVMPTSRAVHRHPHGARRALAEFQLLLERQPDDLVYRWLLNLTHMVLGEYPDRVPPQWLIPPKVFASDTDFPRFYDVAGYLGLNALGLAGGVAIEDFDRDGFLDMLVSSVGYLDQLRYFHNEGNGRFAEWTERAGLKGIVGGLNLCHADYNNDGHPDVLVLRGGWQREFGRQPMSLLHNNGNGTFVDATEGAGLLSYRPRQTASWADFDGDGWLDLFVGNEPSPPYGMPCELFHNNRDGTFTECAGRLRLAATGVCKGVAWGDYNNDGRPDLFISRNGQPNLLFRNDGPAGRASATEQRRRTGTPWWRFTDVSAEAGIQQPVWSFPCWFFDYDNDGWEDLVVFGYDQRDPQRHMRSVVKEYLGMPHEGPTPRVYRNRGNGSFEDMTREVGMETVLAAMGCNFGDLDSDGYLDFYVGTGDPDLRTLIPNRMFRNDGGRRFQDVTTAGGFGHIQKGHGIAFADLDNDGDQDVYADLGGFLVSDVAHNALFENPGFGNHWLTLGLDGARSNRSAIGARVRVDIESPDGPRSVHRVVNTGGSFGSGPLRREIGLGRAQKVRQLVITWPTTGRTDTYQDVPLDRVVTIREGDSRATVARSSSIALSPHQVSMPRGGN
jgi:hypothetical protein